MAARQLNDGAVNSLAVVKGGQRAATPSSVRLRRQVFHVKRLNLVKRVSSAGWRVAAVRRPRHVNSPGNDNQYQ